MGFICPRCFGSVAICSFCAKVSTEVERLIKAPADTPGTAFICNECVAICVEVLAEQAKKQARCSEAKRD